MNDIKEDETNPSTPGNEAIVTAPQEKLMLRMLVVWCVILVWQDGCKTIILQRISLASA
jgi:hypothetical protein